MNEFDACIPPQQLCARTAKYRDVDAVIIGISMVKHDYRFAAGAQNAVYFAYGSCGIRCVMEHAVRIDQVERVVGKIEAFSVSDTKSAGQLKQIKATFCEVHGGLSQIDAGVMCAGFSELSAV